MTKKIVLILFACCLVPVGALAAIYLVHIPVSSVLLLGIVLLCPLSHLLLMKFINHGDNEILHFTRSDEHLNH